MWRKSREAEERKYFMRCIENMEEEDLEDGMFTKELPRLKIVRHHDLLEKLWGWERLLPMGDSVKWPEYSTYLKEYHRRNVDSVSSIDALSQTCLNSEEQLVSECKIQMKSEFLTRRELVVLSCLIHERVRSFISTGCRFSHVSSAALLGREIRGCALGLMNCTSDNSVAAAAVMLGMAKEAEMLCAWMSENNKPVDFYDDDPITDELSNSHRIRYGTLDIMVNILQDSSPAAAAGHKVDKEGPASRNDPGGDGDGITADGAANTTGGGISDVLNSQYKKKIGSGDKTKMKKEDLLENLWGWERLLPLSGSAKWADYLSYLEEYYQRNASEFVAGALADQNPEDSQIASSGYIGAALAKSCLKMEEELLSEWKTRVDETLPISTIIQSALIKELALSKICSTGGELFAPSDVAFVCMANEAELMVELQKHGVKIFDDMMEQSSMIRMCALGLAVANLRGHQSMAPAAAMLGIAKEAKKMRDWIKRENKIVTFSSCEPHDLEE